jgi:PAS domain S-box-containing protein
MKYLHLTIIIMLLISLPAIALTNTVIVQSARSEFMASNEARMEGIAANLEGNIDNFLLDRQDLVSTLAEEPSVPMDVKAIIDDFYGGTSATDERDRISSLMDAYTYGRYDRSTLVLMDGTNGAIVLCPSEATFEGYIPLNGSELDAAREARSSFYLQNLPWEASPSFVLAAPIMDAFDQTVAVMAWLVETEELGTTVVSYDDLGPGGGAYLIGTDGRLLTPSPDGTIAGTVSVSEGGRKALRGGSGFLETENRENEKVLEAYEYLQNWDLALVVEMKKDVAESGVEVVQISAAAAVIIVAGALLVISIAISKNLARDLGALVKWSSKVGDGDWEAPLELGGTNEFKELEVAFEQMVRDMEKHQSQLRVAERRFSSLFRNSLDPVYIARSDGRIMELNAAGERVLGLPKLPDGSFGYSLEELFADDDARKDFIGRLDREDAVAGFEARLLLPSRRELYVLISATRRLDDHGRTLAYQGVIHDITDRKRFEEALIEAKNEAEFYCDIMSHDLNNAVQGLGGYLELCNLASNLEDINQFLPYAHDQMARASDLLRNVRRLSRLGSQDVELSTYDLKKLLVKATWAVERVHPHDTIDIKFEAPEETMSVHGESFIEDVFINLMDNAVKYDTHETKVVEVTLKKVQIDGVDRWQVRVADRGPGVADRDKQTIFGRFERRALKEYGTGLGLSIVVKAVERSNGRTWVEDRVEGDHTQGAIFVVELVAADG